MPPSRYGCTGPRYRKKSIAETWTGTVTRERTSSPPTACTSWRTATSPSTAIPPVRRALTWAPPERRVAPGRPRVAERWTPVPTPGSEYAWASAPAGSRHEKTRAEASARGISWSSLPPPGPGSRRDGETGGGAMDNASPVTRKTWKDELPYLIGATVAQFAVLRAVDWARKSADSNETARQLLDRHFYFAPQILFVLMC